MAFFKGKKTLFISVIVCFTGYLSCDRPAKQQLLLNDTFVYNRNGRIYNQYPESFDKERVIITYLDLRIIDYVLRETPRGKIDKIIRDNPNWLFVFVCDSQLKDSSIVVNKLNHYGCDFPVILDVDHEFEREYRLEHFLATTFVIKGNKRNNLGIIGASNSFFDSEFDRYKQSVRL